VYQNNGDANFTDVTEIVAPAFRKAGMVTDIVSCDINGDGTPEMIVTGEWMSPLAFYLSEGIFETMDIGLEAYSGWWNVVKANDLDKDGDLDLILGNRGENFYFSASAQSPVKLWLADFDENGTIENLVTRTVRGEDMPLALKNELSEHLPGQVKKDLMHREYAKRSMRELFPAEMLSKAHVKEATYFSSVVAVNDGSGKFVLKALPDPVQFSCVYGIVCHDVNNDGNTDLVMGGNDFGFIPQFSRLDASFGHVLTNDGMLNFSIEPTARSGLLVRGQIRRIQEFRFGDDQYLVLGLNDMPPEIYKFEHP
jgi:hypothetical protein